ncbi:hypothetical protein T439DRAFT_97198 [Meredithblackwellia eburnea MCA 4105]
MDESDTLKNIQAGAREILDGYPLAAGLTPVADVIKHLPHPRPPMPSLFPAPGSLSLHAGPDEPLFRQYEQEIAILLQQQPLALSQEDYAWRQREIERLSALLRTEDLNYSASFQAPAPPFPLPTFPAPPPPSEPQAGSSLATHLLAASSRPYPTPPPPIASSHPVDPDTSPGFFASFLAHQYASIPKSSLTPTSFSSPNSTPKASTSKVRPFQPESSPDPLAMDVEAPARPPHSNGAHNFNSMRATTPPRSISRTPSGSPLKSGGSNRSFTLEIPQATEAQKRSLKITLANPNFGSVRTVNGDLRMTDSQRARKTSTDDAFGTPRSVAGVESPLKKIKLDSGGTPGTGRSMKNNDKKDIIERLSDLVSDIFSADDARVGDTSTTHLGSTSHSAGSGVVIFRSSLTTSDGLPLLSTDSLRRLARFAGKVASLGKGDELLEDLEEGGVGRLLKILERSWSVCEDLDFWPAEAVMVKHDDGGVPKGKKANSGKSRKVSKTPAGDDGDGERSSPSRTPAGGSRRSSRSRSPTVPIPADNEMDVESDDDGEFWSETHLENFTTSARNMQDGLLAVQTAFAILTSAELPKRLYSADFLTAMVDSVRKSVDSLLYPVLEAQSNSHLFELASLEPDAFREVCDALTGTLSHYHQFVRTEELGEDLIISTTFFALSPFFHEAPAAISAKGRRVESGNVVADAIKSIRLSCLTLVRAIFGRYPDQRSGVVDEVLNNLTKLEISKKVKGTYRLRNGAAIHTVSALVLHLIQSCPTDLASQIRTRINAASKPKGELNGDKEEESDGQEEEDLARSPVDICRDFLEAALDDSHKAARTIVAFLLQKSCKAGKAAAGSTESEYRIVLDNLINDALAALHLSEWPGAELFLFVCGRTMIGLVDDPKTTNEANALKGTSLDHLGPIGARIRQDLTLSQCQGSLSTLAEIVQERDVTAFTRMISAQDEVLDYLIRNEKNTGEGAALFARAAFCHDLAQASKAVSNILEDYSPAQLSEDPLAQRTASLAALMSEKVSVLWSSYTEDDVFGSSAEETQQRIDLLELQLSRSRNFAGLYRAILDRLLSSSESPAVNFRTKSLRGISLLVAQDPELFLQDDVIASIKGRFVDSSPAVRDTAIELVGKYVVGRPSLAIKYLPLISDRITDAGVSVRRRVVKLLRQLFPVVDQEALRIDICLKLVWRAGGDDDDGVKELAVDAIEEIWFLSPLPSGQRSTNGQGDSGREGIGRLARIVLAVTGTFGDRPPPVETVLRQIMEKHESKPNTSTSAPSVRLKDIMEFLIDNLMEDSESIDLVACIKTVYVLNCTDPSLLSTTKTALLLPYLKSANTAAEHALSDYLLKIFRSTMSTLPKGSSQFSRDLQATLFPMLNKPSSNLSFQQEVVACFCAVVRGQTHDFAKLITVYKALLAKLITTSKILTSEPQKANIRLIPMLAYMCSLLSEHGNFDLLRSEYDSTKEALDGITSGSIHEHLYDQLQRLYVLPAASEVQLALLTSLSFMFRSYPTLMLKEKSLAIFDAIFESSDEKARFQLLKIFQDFLASQDRTLNLERKPKSKVKAEGGVKIEELVGNVEGFADSGVASSISQRYMNVIFDSAKSTNPRVQRIAVDILTTVARSGFGHPLMIAPVLVALSSTSDANLASKAFATLSVLHQKHATLLASRFFAAAESAHEYASKTTLDGSAVHGYDVETSASRFGRWFTLYQKEKRADSMNYLKVITRTAFELEPGAPCSDNDVSLARFVGEALSTLDYKRQEEPMLVIHFLNSALAVSGLQVLHLLEESLAGGGGLMASISDSTASPIQGQGLDGTLPSADHARQSIICGIALLLRDHLKLLYGITDAKMSKFDPRKKSTVGDRPVARKADAVAALGSDGYPRMPLAVHALSTPEDLIEQRRTYIQLIAEDGTVGAMEELDADDE